jgi:hypothetical protein
MTAMLASDVVQVADVVTVAVLPSLYSAVATKA